MSSMFASAAGFEATAQAPADKDQAQSGSLEIATAATTAGTGSNDVPSKPVNPRRKKIQRKTKAGRLVCEIKPKDLEQCFHLPEHNACKRLGIGLTVFKRVCRKFEIQRWPYRKVQRLQHVLKKVEAGFGFSADYFTIQSIVEDLNVSLPSPCWNKIMGKLAETWKDFDPKLCKPDVLLATSMAQPGNTAGERSELQKDSAEHKSCGSLRDSAQSGMEDVQDKDSSQQPRALSHLHASPSTSQRSHDKQGNVTLNPFANVPSQLEGLTLPNSVKVPASSQLQSVSFSLKAQEQGNQQRKEGQAADGDGQQVFRRPSLPGEKRDLSEFVDGNRSLVDGFRHQSMPSTEGTMKFGNRGNINELFLNTLRQSSFPHAENLSSLFLKDLSQIKEGVDGKRFNMRQASLAESNNNSSSTLANLQAIHPFAAVGNMQPVATTSQDFRQNSVQSVAHSGAAEQDAFRQSSLPALRELFTQLVAVEGSSLRQSSLPAHVQASQSGFRQNSAASVADLCSQLVGASKSVGAQQPPSAAPPLLNPTAVAALGFHGQDQPLNGQTLPPNVDPGTLMFAFQAACMQSGQQQHSIPHQLQPGHSNTLQSAMMAGFWSCVTEASKWLKLANDAAAGASVERLPAAPMQVPPPLMPQALPFAGGPAMEQFMSAFFAGQGVSVPRMTTQQLPVTTPAAEATAPSGITTELQMYEKLLQQLAAQGKLGVVKTD